MPPKVEGPLNTLIGEGSIFQGKFYVHGSFQIDGKFEGEIKSEEHLYVGETGKVKTEIIRAKKVSIAGIVLGDIEAIEEVRLLSTGRVLGNIMAPMISIEPGVVVKGNMTITAGQKKEVDKIIEDAYSAGPSVNFDQYFEEEKKKLTDLKAKEAPAK